MKRNLIRIFLAIGALAYTQASFGGSAIEQIAVFRGVQVTGVTVSESGRIFANFPRWREGVPFSVVEVDSKDGSHRAYPNAEMNGWLIGDKLSENRFVGVQSVVAFGEHLYVLDTRNVLFSGIVDEPRLFVFDLATDSLERVIKIPSPVAKPNSYVNDLRIDEQRGRIYLTDSSAGGLIVVDLESGKARRVLDEHPSTMAEADSLLIDGVKWPNAIHSDGIAFNAAAGRLYYHALTGYSLYSIDADALDGTDEEIVAAVHFEAKTSAPDGMIFDKKGNLFYADLEHRKINFLTPEGVAKTLVAGSGIKWADTFGIYDGYLYFTNSRIHEAGGDISEMDFTINRIRLP